MCADDDIGIDAMHFHYSIRKISSNNSKRMLPKLIGSTFFFNLDQFTDHDY